jgi:hypothetical protein
MMKLHSLSSTAYSQPIVEVNKRTMFFYVADYDAFLLSETIIYLIGDRCSYKVFP